MVVGTNYKEGFPYFWFLLKHFWKFIKGFLFYPLIHLILPTFLISELPSVKFNFVGASSFIAFGFHQLWKSHKKWRMSYAQIKRFPDCHIFMADLCRRIWDSEKRSRNESRQDTIRSQFYKTFFVVFTTKVLSYLNYVKILQFICTANYNKFCETV